MAVRPAEILANRARRALAHPGSVDQVSISSELVGRWSRTSIVDGVRWNTYSSLTTFANSGMTCTAVAPVPMMPTRLSCRSTS